MSLASKLPLVGWVRTKLRDWTWREQIYGYMLARRLQASDLRHARYQDMDTCR
jgi:hypothetical protein